MDPITKQIHNILNAYKQTKDSLNYAVSIIECLTPNQLQHLEDHVLDEPIDWQRLKQPLK